MDAKTISKLIRSIPDYPKPGILFRDISPLLADADAFDEVIDAMATRVETHGARAIVAIEARGFLFGAAIAARVQLPLHLARKAGKLPGDTVSAAYSLEYGNDQLEIHSDAFAPDSRCAIIDDLIATGGTAAATAELIRKLGARPVCCAVLLELRGLGARERLGDVPLEALLVESP